MRTKEAIAEIKSAGHDISDEYTTEECIRLLNSAIQEVSALLIAARSPVVVKEINLHDNESTPERYVSPCGRYPIKVTGNMVEFLDKGQDTIRFRYFQTLPLLDGDAGELPFPHEGLNDYAVKVATLFALNRNEYDITQDKALYDEFRQLLTGAVSVGG